MLKQKIIAQIEDQGVIAIIRGVKSDKFAPLLIALEQGGVCVAEVTFGAQSDQETCELLKTALSLAKPYQYIGAGTVTCLQRAKLAFPIWTFAFPGAIIYFMILYPWHVGLCRR